MKYNIPSPLKQEHEELHAGVAKATKARGSTGEATKAVAKVRGAEPGSGRCGYFVAREAYFDAETGTV
jgi:hypothetical protein